jgi:glycosyltransferase involved in cell wall biosynthesis
MPDQNHNPKVSIILPTYNRAGLIMETIESIRHQTYSNWELIIVDDGS